MTKRELESVFALWDSLSEFNSAESDAAIRHLFESLAKLLHVDNVFWFVAVRLVSGEAADRDPAHGWWMRSYEVWRPDPAKHERLKVPSSRGGTGAGGGEPRLCSDGGGAFGRSAHPVWTRPGCCAGRSPWMCLRA